jgi:hypothetical protein
VEGCRKDSKAESIHRLMDTMVMTTSERRAAGRGEYHHHVYAVGARISSLGIICHSPSNNVCGTARAKRSRSV